MDPRLKPITPKSLLSMRVKSIRDNTALDAEETLEAMHTFREQVINIMVFCEQQSVELEH